MEDYKEELKIFQINTNHYDFKTDINSEIINIIVNNHTKRLDINTNKLSTFKKDNYTYFLYSYKEEEKDSIWKNFFSAELTKNHNFKKSHFSFVLFIVSSENIFAVIGGSGIRAITRYKNERFGIDLYERFGNPIEDKLISYTVRGVTGNSSEKKEILNTVTSVNQIIDLTEIPTKLTIPLKQEVIDTFFSFLNIDSSINFLEIGSYFHIKKKISFLQLHEVIKSLELIYSSAYFNPISSFVKINNKNPIISDLNYEVILKLNDELNYLINPILFNLYEKFEIDFLHPKNLNDFVECDEYQVFEPSKKSASIHTKNRFEIYDLIILKATEYNFNIEELKNYFRKMRVLGFRNGIKKTEAPFLNHLTLELKIKNKNYFKIDNSWYEVNDNFISKINDQCVNLITENYLESNFLNKVWDKNKKEENYNKLYQEEDNFLVFDKVLPQNIEICDLIYFDKVNQKIYFIHVKKGFDAKIRDLSNQIKISSDRLFNALNDNTEKYSFLKTFIDDYNKNNTLKIIFQEFLNELKNSKIEFVFAFKSSKKRISIDDLVKKSNSNIAKYSTILCFKSIKNYPLKIFNLKDNE